MNWQDALSDLQELGNESDREVLQRFFKTGPGDYAQGDVFVGVRVPKIRALARKYSHLDLSGVLRLLHSEIHESRFLALAILCGKFKKSSAQEQGRIYRLYLDNTQFINNWDLVDVTCEHIVGVYLQGRSRSPLYDLSRSENLWERRISVVSTFHFIRHNDFSDTIGISKILLKDSHELIHKATGWMLREVGKRDVNLLIEFLQTHGREMPRTMLRYAIEKFSQEDRAVYMKRE